MNENKRKTNTEGRKVLLGAGTSGRGENIRKECGRVSMMEILCSHVQKWKNETC
jgi:hypothetical protein